MEFKLSLEARIYVLFSLLDHIIVETFFVVEYVVELPILSVLLLLVVITVTINCYPFKE